MSRLTLLALAALLGATLAMPAAAQWKWKDTRGQIQYSDTPPPAGTADKDILQRPNAVRQVAAPAKAPTPASGASAPTPKTTDPELEAKRKKAEQEESAKKKAEEDKLAVARAENCKRAKGYMRTLDDGIRIARTNEKGEREFLDDKARAEEARRTKEIIASDCKQ